MVKKEKGRKTKEYLDNFFDEDNIKLAKADLIERFENMGDSYKSDPTMGRYVTFGAKGQENLEMMTKGIEGELDYQPVTKDNVGIYQSMLHETEKEWQETGTYTIKTDLPFKIMRLKHKIADFCEKNPDVKPFELNPSKDLMKAFKGYKKDKTYKK